MFVLMSCQQSTFLTWEYTLIVSDMSMKAYMYMKTELLTGLQLDCPQRWMENIYVGYISIYISDIYLTHVSCSDTVTNFWFLCNITIVRGQGWKNHDFLNQEIQIFFY